MFVKIMRYVRQVLSILHGILKFPLFTNINVDRKGGNVSADDDRNLTV
jgi:hypothetical protein